MRTLLLAYDESIPDYEGVDFGEVIVEFILENEKTCHLESPVSSTIYITTNKIAALRRWYDLLHEHFGRHFKFTLCVVKENTNGEDLIMQYPKPSIVRDFDAIVEKVRKRRGWD